MSESERVVRGLQKKIELIVATRGAPKPSSQAAAWDMIRTAAKHLNKYFSPLTKTFHQYI